MSRKGHHIKLFCLFLLLWCHPVFAQQIVEDSVAQPFYSYRNFDSLSSPLQPAEVRKIPDSVVNEIKTDEAYWYANAVPEKKQQKKRGAAEDSKTGWFSTLLWVIVIAVFVGVLVWYLASSNIKLFRKKTASVSGAEEEAITENIFEINYEREIDTAVAAQDYRLATRLMYLRALREMAELQIIDYQHGKTNSDYLSQLSGSHYYKDFFRLTREFEYTWYGKFQLSPESFVMVENDFARFKQLMP